MLCRMFALPAGTVPIVLNVDVPDRALTAAFQAAGAALAALTSPARDDPEHRAAIQEAVGFAIKGVLIATGHARPVPRPGRPRGAGAGSPHPSPRAQVISAGPHGRPPRALRAHGDRAGPGRRRRSPGDGRRGTRARGAGRGRPVRV